MTKLRCMLCCLMICTITIDARTVNDIYKRISAQVSLKVPGNQSRNYSLAFQGAVDDKGIYLLESEEKIPLIITERIERDNVKCVMVVSITALEDVYFNYQQQLKTGFRHNDCMFYLPGFWYSRNLRSPKGAPSFHISESWLVREDRLSSPLTGIFNQKDGRYMTVARKDDFQWDALATHQTGEIILSGKTSLGFTGFESHDGTSTLSFGFPYREAPKTYIRKLTLAPEVTSFQYLKKGETDFDPTYHWTITGASIEGEEKVAGFAASICYAANGKAYGYIDIPGYYKPGETGHGAIASRAVVFDLYNQKMKKIEGLDLSNGYGVLVSKYKDGLAIANASTTTKGIYYLNPQTDKINPIPMITTIGNPMAIEWFGN